MKNWIFLAVLLVGFTSWSQQPESNKKELRKERKQRMNEFSPEQQAALRTKKLALHLDLSEAQQQQVQPIILEMLLLRKERTNVNYETLSTAQRFELRSDGLDKQLEMKQKMKNILSEVQYEKWEKSKRSQNKKVMRRKKSRG